MSLWQVIVLALLQGVTEFLPISSSAHLILVPAWLGWEDQGIAFDVAVHFGSLLAVLVFSRREIAAILGEWRASLFGGAAAGPSARLGYMIILASLPVGVLGLLLHDTVEASFREPKLIAVAGAAFAILMVWADRRPQPLTRIREIGWKQAFWIGCGQALALIPGASRSGVTMTAARALGMARPAAAGCRSCWPFRSSWGGGTGNAEPGRGAGCGRPRCAGARPCGIGRGRLRVHGNAVAARGALGLWPFALYRLALSAVILL